MVVLTIYERAQQKHKTHTHAQTKQTKQTKQTDNNNNDNVVKYSVCFLFLPNVALIFCCKAVLHVAGLLYTETSEAA
eukprot:m.28733 g.28733  ORF g.28733 m.28733 type:complete len:77 (-) comp10471_c0_seq2:365-595(-)